MLQSDQRISQISILNVFLAAFPYGFCVAVVELAIFRFPRTELLVGFPDARRPEFGQREFTKFAVEILCRGKFGNLLKCGTVLFHNQRPSPIIHPRKIAHARILGGGINP